MLSKAFPAEPQTETSDSVNLGLINMLMKRSCDKPQECSTDDISLTRKRPLDDRELAFEASKRIQSSKERSVEFEHRIQENVLIRVTSLERWRGKGSLKVNAKIHTYATLNSMNR